MQCSRMDPFGLAAKLPPNRHGVRRRCRYILGHLGFLVTRLFRPLVLMLLADLVALRIVVVFPEVKPVYPPLCLQNQYKGQSRDGGL